MRRTIAVLFCATLAMAVGAVAAPPPGLSPYGKIAWNFEALARSYYGTAEVCADSRTTARNYTARTCASVPEADQYVYEPVFAVPTQSAFNKTPSILNPKFAIPRFVRGSGVREREA